MSSETLESPAPGPAPGQQPAAQPSAAPAIEELTVRQVAELAGVQRAAVNKAIRGGRLAARKEETPRGAIYWVPRPAAEAYAATVAANPHPRPYNSWHATRLLADRDAAKSG